ncbi:KaiC domain-containing protein [Natronoarchaeum mannanilyticum]|uniref:KaiC domain-containing protein n=1 Tax=Natronoarchaeum mannanilyticum TaxID=926360 RepID=UPI003CD086A6
MADDERSEFDAAFDDLPEPDDDATFDDLPEPGEDDEFDGGRTTDADSADADAEPADADAQSASSPDSQARRDADAGRPDSEAPDADAGRPASEVSGADTPTDEREPSDDQGDDGGLFDTDFASALGDAPDLPGESDKGSPGGGPSGSGQSGGFGSGSSGFGGGGSGEFGGGGGEFDMATDDAGALGDLDDVGAPGAGSDFEQQDEAHESEIPRIELGVEGLDAMIQGGVPERSLMVAIGSAGTGKTTLGLQFLERGLEQGERAVYITLEESRSRVIRSATEKGFAYDEYAADGQLAVVDIDPVEMANSLQSIRSELPRLIRDFGASRLVLDSVSLLEMMYDDRAVRRNEIYDFTRSLKDAGVTTLLTSEASEDSAFASRHGIVEYLTDAVFVLQYVRPSDFRETRLAIEIQKIRDANHSRETKPYEITNEGINVYRQANIF